MSEKKVRLYTLEIILTTPMLGTIPLEANKAESYVLAKAEDSLPADERTTLPFDADLELAKITTGFHRFPDSKIPLIYSYVVKGFLKNAGKVFNGQRAVKNLKSKVNDYVFVGPRQITLHLPEGGQIGMLSRPLRAETAQGPRTALARSETVPEGTWLHCDVEVLSEELKDELLRDLLDYGAKMGLGQWRNSGVYGTFSYKFESKPSRP